MTLIGSTESPESMERQDSPWGVHQGDARQTDAFLGGVARSLGAPGVPFVTATITSPPYANLVDYGRAGQIGFGQSFDQYLDECEKVFADVHKWTRDDGSLWVVADTLLDSGVKGRTSALVPLPFALAERASNAGWTLKDVIVWRKDRTRPWRAPGRLRNGFEYVLFFVKGPRFKYHVDRLRDLRGLKHWWVKYPERHNPWGMVPDNVWDIPIPVQGSWASSDLRHACPFPEELVHRMIDVSSDEGDVIFDPFSGSGMVAAVSESRGRLPLGTELNEDFCEAYRKHVRPTVISRESAVLDVDVMEITASLLALRVLKYPKELQKQLLRSGVNREQLLGAAVFPDEFGLDPRPVPYATGNGVVFVPDWVTDLEISAIEDAVARVCTVPPLSKFGLDLSLDVMRVSDYRADGPLYCYTGGKTWSSSCSVSEEDFVVWIKSQSDKKVPPVLSPIDVHVELEESR